jgi:hypothetical protein
VKRVWVLIFVSMLIIFVLLDLLLVIGHIHIEFPWSHIAGFFSLFGFIGCLAIVAVAKLLGHYWLQRKEDYYNKRGDDE